MSEMLIILEDFYFKVKNNKLKEEIYKEINYFRGKPFKKVSIVKAIVLNVINSCYKSDIRIKNKLIKKYKKMDFNKAKIFINRLNKIL